MLQNLKAYSKPYGIFSPVLQTSHVSISLLTTSTPSISPPRCGRQNAIDHLCAKYILCLHPSKSSRRYSSCGCLRMADGRRRARSGDGGFGGDDAGEEENVRGERLVDQSGRVLWVCEWCIYIYGTVVMVKRRPRPFPWR